MAIKETDCGKNIHNEGNQNDVQSDSISSYWRYSNLSCETCPKSGLTLSRELDQITSRGLFSSVLLRRQIPQ